MNDEVNINKDCFHQIIYAVLKNAVLYTQENGHVIFTITQGSNISSGRTRYVFTIEDDGVGMSENFLQHVFDPFARENDTTHSGIAGAGLGLLTAKNLLESIDGGIIVQSIEGKGSKVIMIAMLHPLEDTSIQVKHQLLD